MWFAKLLGEAFSNNGKPQVLLLGYMLYCSKLYAIPQVLFLLLRGPALIFFVSKCVPQKSLHSLVNCITMNSHQVFNTVHL